MAWMQTAGGGVFDLMDPTPEMVDWHDVILSLAKQCRFNGHCRRFCSVAEHSISVADLLPPELRLYGLLHDAHEAYVGDVPAPLKRLLWRGGFAEIEARIDRAIYARAGLPYPTRSVRAEVRHADVRVLLAERRDLLATPAPAAWTEVEGIDPDPRPVVGYDWPVMVGRFRKALREASLDCGDGPRVA